MTGTVGIVVNTDKVKDPISGYRDVFKPKYKNRIVVLNDNREIVSWALVTLGHRSKRRSLPAISRRRSPLVAEWIKLVKVFDSDSPKTPLLNGDVDLGVVWSGEAALFYRKNKKFTLCAAGRRLRTRSSTCLAIPTGAPNKSRRRIGSWTTCCGRR